MRSDAQYGTILVVDDNVAIRGLAEKFLERAGYSVATAADGGEGLRYYQQHQSSIVLLLTDVTMPNMNGLELAKHVLRIDSRLPVLFMSGDANCVFRGLECLAKPFQSGQLLESLNRLLTRNTHLEKTGVRSIALAEALQALERRSLRI
jgi:CheY-like chemotaxis protein